MTRVAATECTGTWRRTLLIDADGARHDGGDIRWLQGPTAYVDSRGFAGTLSQREDVFEWHREVDLEPPGEFPDAGSMRWDGDTLIETGVHEHYAEHWRREDGPSTPCGALFLHRPDGQRGLLVWAGRRFGWAGAGEVVIDAVGNSRWAAIEFEKTEIQTNGVSWEVERREGDDIP